MGDPMRCTQATRHHTLSIRTSILKKEEEKKKKKDI